MISAKEAAQTMKSVPPEERVAAVRKRIGEVTIAALDAGIRASVAANRRRVELVLYADVCRERDEDLREFLCSFGYCDVDVTSAFPCHGEDFEGRTNFRFSIPSEDPDELP
jgi:hypothetical protein